MTLNKKEKDKKKKEKIPLQTKEEIASDIIKQLPEIEVKKVIKKTRKNKNWWWVEPKINENVLQKLKVCFAVGMTDVQACYFCWIAERTLYYYQSENPEFAKEKDILKQSITLQAKFNIWRTIKTEEAKPYWWTTNSWKWLEKKDPEFWNKLQLEGTVWVEMTQEDEEMYKNILKKNWFLWQK